MTGGKLMVSWSDRWSKAKQSDIQVSYFNGLGVLSWENIWGTWNQLTARDAEALRRVGTILRFFGKRGFFTTQHWIPHSPEMLQMSTGVFGSAFSISGGQGTRETVYTIINRRPNATGVSPQIRPNITAKEKSVLRFYDCYRGQQLHLDPVSQALWFEIEAGGYGCVVATPNATDTEAMSAPLLPDNIIRGSTKLAPTNLTYLLRVMRAMTTQPITSFSPQFHVLPQRMVPIPSTNLRNLSRLRDDEVTCPQVRAFRSVLRTHSWSVLTRNGPTI